MTLLAPRCPRCGECPFPGGVCEQRVNRGRRFFLMGALALPVARQVEAVAALVAPPAIVTSVTVDFFPATTPDMLESMRLMGAATARTADAIMRHVFRDALFPKLIMSDRPLFPALVDEPSTFPAVRG